MNRYRALYVALAIAAALTLPAFADTTPQTLPFAQNWTNVGMITVNDDWSGVPGIEGYLGDDASTTASPYGGGDPQTVLTFFGAIDAIANQANPNTLTSGGVAEFDGIADPVAALQGSGTADAPYILIHLNTTGWQNIQVVYNLRDVDGSTDNSTQPVALQYRVGNAGSFTNVPGAYVADASVGPSLTGTTPVSVSLPVDCDNQPLVQVRMITINAVGSDEWIGIDDISITGTVVPVELMGFTAD